MKLKKNLIFLALVMTACMLLSACSAGQAGGAENSDPPETDMPVDTPTSTDTEPEEPEEPEEPPVQEWQWQHSTLQEQNIRADAIEALHTELDSTEVQSAIIIRNDQIADEYWKEGYTADSVFDLHSCSKSVTSALIGIAIDKGFIEGVDVPISEYFPEIASNGSDYQKQITIRHLLTHTSGIDYSDDTLWDEWRASENWVDYILNRSVTARPGTVFSYSTGNTHLLSAILQQATGQTALEFGREYLFEPLGMDSVECGTDPQGISDGGNGFRMNAYDMAKFGRLFLNKGNWNGEQIISSEWIDASTTLQFERSSGSADYGYQWWVRTFGDNDYDAYFAQGHFGQYIFVVPDLELIVTFTSHHTGSSSMYWQFMNTIVNACA